MSAVNSTDEVLHRIRVKLYPSRLPGAEGTYIARADNEAVLSVEDVCAALKNRGGFTGNYQDLIEYVKQFFNEAAYQLCDGFAVNTGYYSVHPNVGGIFTQADETHDHRRHPIGFRFRTQAPLRKLVRHITVDIRGLGEAEGYIDRFIDIDSDSVNDSLSPGGMFSLCGHKIKVAGEDPGCGVYFVNAADPRDAHKVTARLAENVPGKVIGIIPGLASGQWKVEVRTQFAGSGAIYLRAPRSIGAGCILTVQ